jgi:predicted phosphodiesterase
MLKDWQDAFGHEIYDYFKGKGRLAVLADTHGNLPALEAVLADARQQGVDGIIVAGDLTTGGPHQLETINLLRSLGSWMIRGNNAITL